MEDFTHICVLKIILVFSDKLVFKNSGVKVDFWMQQKFKGKNTIPILCIDLKNKVDPLKFNKNVN